MSEMSYVAVGNDADLAEGGLLGVNVGGTPVVVARVEGKLYAIGSVCTHRQGSLAEGEISGRNVVCPLHGSEFDLATGEVVVSPATEPEPVYDVKVEGGKILVSTAPRQ